jgi:hypothetical protein
MLTLPQVEEVISAGRVIPPSDVVCANFEMKLCGRFYPLGFPADVHTNSQEVLDLVAESWGTFQQLWHTEPIMLRVGVTDGEPKEIFETTTSRVQQNVFCYIADREHYGITDMNTSLSTVWITQGSLKQQRAFVRYNFLECGMIVPIVTRFTTGVHSACVGHNGTGILLCGDSGAGKSTLSYACAKAGWSYLTDDGSFLVHDSNDLIAVGNCHQIRFRPATAGFFPEINDYAVTQRSKTSKPSIEIVPAEFHSIRAVPSLPVHYMVMLNRREGINESLRPYDKNIVRAYLRQGHLSPQNKMPDHYRMIDRLLERDVLELRYRNLDWAIEQLETLVR